MKKLIALLLVLVMVLGLVACGKADAPAAVPLRGYDVQGIYCQSAP